jgi:hypothetical protein
MAVDPNGSAAQNYEDNTDGDEWFNAANNADIDGDSWTSGLADAGVEGTEDIDGDSVWGDQYSVSEDDADEYDANATAEAWASGWGDASNWNV